MDQHLHLYEHFGECPTCLFHDLGRAVTNRQRNKAKSRQNKVVSSAASTTCSVLFSRSNTTESSGGFTDSSIHQGNKILGE